MIPSNCPYCKESLEVEIMLEYKVSQFYCVDTCMYAEIPKIYGRCNKCLKQITYTKANFYMLYYLKIFGKLMGKVHAAKK